MAKRRRAAGRVGRRRAPIGRKSPSRTEGDFLQRYFSLIFAAVMVIIIASGVGAYHLAVETGSLADFQKSLDTILNMGVGAIIALLGGGRK